MQTNKLASVLIAGGSHDAKAALADILLDKCKIYEAVTEDEIISCLEKNDILLLFLEISDSEIITYRLLSHLRSLEACSALSIIVTAGKEHEEEASDSLVQGADSFLIRPYSAETVDLLIKSAVEHAAGIAESIALGNKYENGLKMAMAQAGRVICSYDVKTLTLTLPDSYAQCYGVHTKIGNIPYAVDQYTFVDEHHQMRYIEFYEKIIAGEPSGSLDIEVKRPDLSIHWETYEFINIFDSAGKPVKAIISIEDTTEEHLLMQQYEHEQKLRRELLKNCIIYYELNVTTDCYAEYISKVKYALDLKPGESKKEENRRQVLENIAPADRERVESVAFAPALHAAYLNGQREVSVEYRRRLDSDDYKWVRARALLLQKPRSGDIIAFVYISDIDISRKNMIAMTTVVRTEIDAVSVVNIKTRQIHVTFTSGTDFDPEANQTVDYDDHIKTRSLYAVAKEDRQIFRSTLLLDRLLKKLEAKPVVTLIYRAKENEPQVIKTTARYLDDTHEDIVLARRAITSEYEEEKNRQNTLETAVKSANTANRAKSDFLSRMSHDMRTPLNTILNMSGDEMNRMATLEEKNEYLQKIHESGEYLLDLVNDVLDMAKIENRMMTIEAAPYSLEDFKKTIETVIGVPCRQKGIKFNFSVSSSASPWSMIDKVRLEQVFVNLLSNSLKFTQEGGQIDFIIENIKQEGRRNTYKCTVKDNGIGMSKAFLPHLFESFSQERKRDASCNACGTGLGLAIVKQAIELMGGSIMVESEPGKGTTFTVILQYDACEPPVSAAKIQESYDFLAGLHILLCEDNKLNTRVIVTILERRGSTVVSAEDGKIGLDAFTASPAGYFDLVMMDLRMPVMDGVEATKGIRASEHPDAKTVPIIALTGDVLSDEIKDLNAIGMNDYLSKPVEPVLLFTTIKKHLKKDAR